MTEKIKTLWEAIYGDTHNTKVNELIKFLDSVELEEAELKKEKDWYKDTVIYSLYVDEFAENFDKMTEKLDYIKDLGADTLWLLPILDSPMHDQGFDICDYTKIRKDLGTNKDFYKFIKEAHEKEIKIIFDIAINHTSMTHDWFVKSKGKEEGYEDFYIWNKDDQKYLDARLLFKGMENNNWEYNEERGEYFFHRFYKFQPDLNYRNPQVIIEIIKNMVFWKTKGVDGLRLDAIPFLWKEEGTNCENLENTHNIIKLIRASLDRVSEGTLLIAEANLEPNQVVEYFGDSDECHAAYHFPLMPKFFMSLAEADFTHIKDIFDEEITPKIPEDCQWITFLRCHDELTLEFVSPEERRKMNQYYLADEKYSFRQGEGIAGRIFNLLGDNQEKVLLIYSMLFASGGTSILYYGDEIAMENNEEFFLEKQKETGYSDPRFFNRGKMAWNKTDNAKYNEYSNEYKVFSGMKDLIKFKRENIDHFRSKIKIKDNYDKRIFEVNYIKNGKELKIIHNLSEDDIVIKLNKSYVDLKNEKNKEGNLTLSSYNYVWLKEI